MSVRILVAELAGLGVPLRSDGTTLEYEGPEGIVTPELLDSLRRHKTELIGLLTGDHSPGRAIGLNPEARELRAAGWEPKERGGKTIWQSPQNGFWYGRHMALELLRLDPLAGPPHDLRVACGGGSWMPTGVRQDRAPPVGTDSHNTPGKESR